MTRIKLLYILTLFSITLSFPAQTMFQKTYGGTGTDVGRAVCITNNGGYVIAGNSDSFGAGGDNMYIIRTKFNGDTVWTKVFGTSNFDMALSVNKTSDGGFIFTGDFTFGGIYMPLMKIDANGNLQWTKSFSGVGNYVHQTNDNGYILVGNNGNADAMAVKTNSVGDTVWIRSFGGVDFDFGKMIQQTSDGGYIMAGSTKSFSGNYDVYLLKLNSTGNLIWSKTFGGNDEDRANSVRQTSDGGFIISGYSKSFNMGNLSSDWYIIKTDNLGNLVWSSTIGCITSIDEAVDIQETSDGGFVAFGTMGCNYFTEALVKMDKLGSVLWSKAYGNNAGNSNCFAQTPDNGFIIPGRIGLDVYLIKTDSLGNSVCNFTNFVVTSTTVPTSVTSPPTLATTGGTFNTPSLTISSGGTITTSCIIVSEKSLQSFYSNISLSPNPAHDFSLLNLPFAYDKMELTFYNSQGNSINLPTEISDRQVKLKVHDLPSGLYYFKISSSDNVWTGKLIVE